MNFCNKLECLSLTSLSSIVYSLSARPGAYPRSEERRVGPNIEENVPTKLQDFEDHDDGNASEETK